MPAGLGQRVEGKGQTNKLDVFSSYQWFSLLDGFLEHAVREMIDSTRMVEHYVSQMMFFQLSNKKRHVSLVHDWRTTIGKMSVFVSDPSWPRFKEINLDRGYQQAMLGDFVASANGYERKYDEYMKSSYLDMMTKHAKEIDDYHRLLCIRGKRDLYQCVASVRYFYECIKAFKNMLIGNYLGYLGKTAGKAGEYGMDLAQEYYAAANKAIDHYNPSKGTFKSYLDIWIRKVYGKKTQENRGASSRSGALSIDDVDEGLEDEESDPMEMSLLAEELSRRVSVNRN